MHAVVLWFDLHIPESRSLKAKRAAIRPIVDTIRNRHHLSVAEVGYLDQWQRSEIAVAAVSGSRSQLEAILDTVERYVETAAGVEVVNRGWTELEDDRK